LRSFRRDESDLFFGREDCINAMVDRLAATRFLGVLGSSGTGKSSVAKTGLLDALDLGLMAAAGSNWRVVDFRPGGAPSRNLARRLLEAGSGTSTPEPGIAASDVALARAFLLRGPRSVVEWCADGHLPPDVNLLLLVDQFEELFRYQDYAGREEAEAFAALLLESTRQRRFPIYVALTMRSEYLGACALIDGLAEAISAGMFLIPRMTREQCRSAIVGPAAVCGFQIEDALVTLLLNDLAVFAPWEGRGTHDQLDRLSRRADQLPLLQYCLNRMWVTARQRDDGGAVVLGRADYQRIGGLEGALNAHADEVLSVLGAEARPVAEGVFRALTEGASAADAVRRPTRFDQLVEIVDAPAAQVQTVVDAFCAPGCNFLVPESDSAHPKPLPGDTIIDISHESLIRQWKQLSQWVEAEARSRRQWRRLLDRFEDRQPLYGAELTNILAWRSAENPTAAWARRYGGDFSNLTEFVDRSVRQSRRFAPLVLPLIQFGVLSFSYIFVVGLLFTIYGNFSKFGNLPYFLVAYSFTGAATVGFALWRYADAAFRRATMFGIAFFVLSLAGSNGFMAVAAALGFDPLAALRWWYAIFSTPLTTGLTAVAVPLFRKPSVWLPLIILGDVPYGVLVWFYYAGALSIGEAGMSNWGYVFSLLLTAFYGFQFTRRLR
jgi:hypothetical protein